MLLLFGICSFSSEASSSFDFSLQLHNDIISVNSSANTTVGMNINLSSGVAGTVSLEGEWIDVTPEGVSVTMQRVQGVPPFLCNLTFQSSNITQSGIYTYNLIARSDDIVHSIRLYVNISSTLVVTLSTNASRYLKGQNIVIFGNATTIQNTSVQSGNVSITITNQNGCSTVYTYLQNNSFNYSYPISYGDPEGTWTIYAQIVDTQGNQGIQSKQVSVSLPSSIVRYAVTFFSPSDHAIYHRGDTICISVFVSEDSASVQNANTTLILPSLETISLVEYADGNYKHEYTLPINTTANELYLTVESRKNDSGSLKVGGSSLPIIVQPASLKLTVLEPVTSEFLLHSTIILRVKAQYLDNTTMQTGSISAVTPNGTISLYRDDNDTYVGNISVSSQSVGNHLIEIQALDSYGNSGSTKKIIFIFIEQQSTFLPLLLSIIAVCIIVSISIFFILRFYSSQRSKSIQEEMAEIQALQDAARKKYYQEGSISKDTYEALIQEHVQRYAHLQKELRKKSKK